MCLTTMGKCCSNCLPKCFPCCGKKRSDKNGTQPQETVPESMNSTSAPISDKNGDMTYAEFVTEQSEKKRKSVTAKKNIGSSARWLERIMCCELFKKQQQPEPSFWIEPPPGFPERCLKVTIRYDGQIGGFVAANNQKHCEYAQYE